MSPPTSSTTTSSSSSSNPSSSDPSNSNAPLRILVFTDTHLGFKDKDDQLGNDAMETFEEILKIGRANKMDFCLHAGDLFDENRPSRQTQFQCINILKQYCCWNNQDGQGPDKKSSDKDSQYQYRPPTFKVTHISPHAYLANPQGRLNFQNFKENNMNDNNSYQNQIQLPIFMIHGNHDDPTGLNRLAEADLLSSAGLVNYFGRQPNLDDITIGPICIEKKHKNQQTGQVTVTRLAIYGMGHVRDERLHRAFERGKVKFLRPPGDEEVQEEEERQKREQQGNSGNGGSGSGGPGSANSNNGNIQTSTNLAQGLLQGIDLAANSNLPQASKTTNNIKPPLRSKQNYFHILLWHQNRPRGMYCNGLINKNSIKEEWLPKWMDLVIFGHEHECKINPVPGKTGTFHCLQPGSSVATSYVGAEAVKKQICYIELKETQYRTLPVVLRTVRPFEIDEIVLKDQKMQYSNNNNNVNLLQQSLSGPQQGLGNLGSMSGGLGQMSQVIGNNSNQSSLGLGLGINSTSSSNSLNSQFQNFDPHNSSNDLNQDLSLPLNPADGRAIWDVLSNKVCEMLQKNIDKQTKHSSKSLKNSKIPLIRLKVDYTDFPCNIIGNNRFGRQFIGRVGNADSILLWVKGKTRNTSSKDGLGGLGGGIDNSDIIQNGDPENANNNKSIDPNNPDNDDSNLNYVINEKGERVLEDQLSHEEFIRLHEQGKLGPNGINSSSNNSVGRQLFSLMPKVQFGILPQKQFNDAVQSFVEKGEGSAIEQFVYSSMYKHNSDVLRKKLEMKLEGGSGDNDISSMPGIGGNELNQSTNTVTNSNNKSNSNLNSTVTITDQLISSYLTLGNSAKGFNHNTTEFEDIIQMDNSDDEGQPGPGPQPNQNQQVPPPAKAGKKQPKARATKAASKPKASKAARGTRHGKSNPIGGALQEAQRFQAEQIQNMNMQQQMRSQQIQQQMLQQQYQQRQGPPVQQQGNMVGGMAMGPMGGQTQQQSQAGPSLGTQGSSSLSTSFLRIGQQLNISNNQIPNQMNQNQMQMNQNQNQAGTKRQKTNDTSMNTQASNSGAGASNRKLPF